MSTTSKSPKKVARAAYLTAQNALPDYSHRFSPKKFTQPQILVCLILKIFFKTDYRGIVAILNDSSELRKTFNLSVVPHFTTLQKASKKLLCSNIANQLLESSVRITCESKIIKLAAVDSTGLEAGHISRYFVRRKRSKQLETYEKTYYRRWPKLAIACDCSNHMILSAITTRGPSVDINQFEKIMTPAINKHIIEQVLADAGYDSESNHRFVRDTNNIKCTIPPKHGRPTTKPFLGKYRRLMQQEFENEIYGQRWQVETVFSMIKRNQGDALLSKTYWAQNREMMLKVLTHNIGIILFAKELFYRAYRTPLIQNDRK
jgi:transposase